MDGGRRFLRTVRMWLAPLLPGAASHPPMAAAVGGGYAAYSPPLVAGAAKPLVSPRRAERPWLDRLSAFAATPGLGMAALLALFAGVGGLGIVQNGGFPAQTTQNADFRDAAARALGFPITAVTISGLNRLREAEILAAAKIDPDKSLLFLDAVATRRQLMQLPLVKDARVLKLYPDRLVINVEEREPAALWQRAGAVSVISGDGAVIDQLSDPRFLGLPFVVGEGAEKRLAEYVALLSDMGDLAGRVKAGVLVSGRRWSLTLKNGVDVKLPEYDPGTAIGALIRLQRESRILDKDLVSIDLRLPDRVAIRLTDDAIAPFDVEAHPARTSAGAHVVNPSVAASTKPVKSGGKI